MVRKGYRNLSIPEQLFKELEAYVKKSNGRYVSVAETVREAVREFLEKQKEAQPWLPPEKTPLRPTFLNFLNLPSDEGLSKIRRDKEGVQ